MSILQPKRSDLDMNNHVNNVKYVRWMLEVNYKMIYSLILQVEIRIIVNVIVDSNLLILISFTDNPRPSFREPPIIWYHTRVQKRVWELRYSSITLWAWRRWNTSWYRETRLQHRSSKWVFHGIRYHKEWWSPCMPWAEPNKLYTPPTSQRGETKWRNCQRKDYMEEEAWSNTISHLVIYLCGSRLR